MANQFGPWATLIDVGGKPQLSAFLRRRMTMLVQASQTRPALSRPRFTVCEPVSIVLSARSEPTHEYLRGIF